ncbi:MAG: ferrous iron transporter B, partial [Candidatus Bathyarchaeia archaeon]
IRYGKEIEDRLERIELAIRKKLPDLPAKYPARWIAVKLLEKDEDIIKKVESLGRGSDISALAYSVAEEIERIHGEPSPVVIASERYSIASGLAKDVSQIEAPPTLHIEERLDSITAHRILGYPILALVMAAMFAAIFIVGNILVSTLEDLFENMLIPAIIDLLSITLPTILVDLVSKGFLSGIAAGVTIALPYLVPFYIILSILEDSGYLPRVAFLLDNPMHKIGLHGKASICLLLGYGCSVPACTGCRIMETQRERLLGGFVTVLVPCAARTVVILGLVGRYIGIPAALGLYAFDLFLVFALGRVGFKALPGEPVGLIMEMPPYKMPSLRTVAKKTWARTRDFVYIAFPLIIGGSIILEILTITGLIWPIADFMNPLIIGWLGLPSIAGMPIMFGILRKELTLVLLADLAGTLNFSQVLTPVQMVVFSLVTMIYVPCIATIATLLREFGWRKTLAISIVDILLALLIGGVASRILPYILS